MVALRRLGKYEILDLLGVGGMGTVYRARDPVLERVVAVKLLHPAREGAGSAAPEPGRFLNEARAVARLNHPAIVAVYDFSDADPAGSFFAMEYVEGCTIEDHVRLAADVRLDLAFDLLPQLLDGLAYAHARGVMHRDIKPSNLLVTPDRRLKITDFGIAKIGATQQTLTGMMLGTPAYMAPERYLGGETDLRSDLYSAGVVLYELLTGRRPFQGTLTELMYQICHVAPARASLVEPAIPEAFDEVLARVLAKKPADRYGSAGEFAAAVAAVGDALGRVPRAAPARGSGSDRGAAADPTAHATLPESDQSPPQGWTGAQLADYERRLTPILGPVARIMVKRAAALTRDPERLGEELLAQLHTDEERRRFLGGASVATTTGSAIAPVTLDKASKVLMRYIGPIGAVLVRRTAPTAQDESELLARLAERITDERERARFLADMARG